jgi:hypothetical protein
LAGGWTNVKKLAPFRHGEKLERKALYVNVYCKTFVMWYLWDAAADETRHLEPVSGLISVDNPGQAELGLKFESEHSSF